VRLFDANLGGANLVAEIEKAMKPTVAWLYPITSSAGDE
jgi:hypothetical protein